MPREKRATWTISLKIESDDSTAVRSAEFSVSGKWTDSSAGTIPAANCIAGDMGVALRAVHSYLLCPEGDVANDFRDGYEDN